MSMRLTTLESLNYRPQDCSAAMTRMRGLRSLSLFLHLSCATDGVVFVTAGLQVNEI